MDAEREESRAVVAREAQRKALVEDVRRAYTMGPVGAVVMGVGIAIVAVMWNLGIVGMSTLLVEGIGFIVLSIGLAIAGRAIVAAVLAKRALRKLDAAALPAARIVS